MKINVEGQITQSEIAPFSSDNILRTPLYFGAKSPLFGWYHAPKAAATAGVGMIICSPIGYEYISGHRAMRHLADRLAHDGIPTLRFDYHGTGDSAGIDEDPDRLKAWLESTKEAINKLKEISGCQKVGLIGVRVGSILASLIAEEIELASLVLWAPCVMGRHYIREMQFLQQSNEQPTADKEGKKGDMESAGFLLSAQTISDLSAVKLTTLRPKKTNILIVARDDLKDNFKLLEAWQKEGLDVDYTRMNGYIDFLAAPHKTKIPFTTISNISNWIGKQHNTESPNQRDTAQEPPSYSDTITLEGSPPIQERIVQFGHKNALFGIICEPIKSAQTEARPTTILLNSGAVHHVGTNRFYVMLARNLAANGFSTLRMDIEGLGDSFIDEIADENALYTPGISKDVDAAITYLKAEDEQKSFIVAGLCFGSYASFHTALQSIHSEIVECIIINPLTFYWKKGMSLDDQGLAKDLSLFKSYQRSMLKGDRWLKLLRGEVDVKGFFRSGIASIGSKIGSKVKPLKQSNKEAGDKQELSTDLNKISASDTYISFIIADRDPGHDLLMLQAKKAVKALMKKERLSIDIISDSTHTFPLSSSRHRAIEKITGNLSQRY